MRRRGSSGRADAFARFGPDEQTRERIAQGAARLILEHGVTDWQHAKRKAARQLALSESAALPGDDEVELALAEYQELFGGPEQARSLRAQREEALLWMRRLREFAPTLVGGVAAGWAGEHSDIRLDLIADDQKAVELVLINREVPYRVGPMGSPSAPAVLCIDTERGGVRLTVRDERAARQRPHRGDGLRLDLAALTRLLESSPDAPGAELDDPA